MTTALTPTPLPRERKARHLHETGKKLSKCARPSFSFPVFQSTHFPTRNTHAKKKKSTFYLLCVCVGMGRMLSSEANQCESVLSLPCESQDDQLGDQHLYLPLEPTLQPETQILYTTFYFFFNIFNRFPPAPCVCACARAPWSPERSRGCQLPGNWSHGWL